jgi:hypothetical protein
VKIKNTHCLTLRIPPELDLLVSDAAYDARLPKSAWIRRAIQRCLQEKRERQEALLR